MLANRSMPRSTVIPALTYPDVGEAVQWLCDVFGFTLRLRIANHRAQLNVGDGAVIVSEPYSGENAAAVSDESSAPRPAPTNSVVVRVPDVDAHHGRAAQRGARILKPPRVIRTENANTSLKTSRGITGRFLNPLPMLLPRNGAARVVKCLRC
jgi:uncharacterized glyoxalase superfamily protein PhnB